MGAITYHARYGLQMIWAGDDPGHGRRGRGVSARRPTRRSATADGLALAYRAGATLADMAFVQFHPTTLYLPGAARFTDLRGHPGRGAHLLDAAGARFMPDVHPLAELAPRDMCEPGDREADLQAGGRHVLAGLPPHRALRRRFPGIAALLRQFELDPASKT
jgi:L-aspartate oxidase